MSQHNLARVNEVVEGEVVAPATAGATVVNTADYIQVMATIQIIVPTEREMSMHILDRFTRLEVQLDTYANNIEYVKNQLSSMQSQSYEVSKLINILHETTEQLKMKEQSLSNLPQWYNVSAVAKNAGLTSGAVRKQLENGEFEDGKDFKHNGGKILIHQGAVERIHRRRSSNG